MEILANAAIHQVLADPVLDERHGESDSSHFSSPISSPVLGSMFLPLHEPTLGVYFEPADGEKNDVLAALRAVRKINKQAVDAVQNVRPRTKQCLDFTAILQSQDKEMQQWLLAQCRIDLTRTLSIRKLPVFSKLARYTRSLRDVEMELPSPSPPISVNRVGTMLRRLSSSASSGSSNSSKYPDRVDPRMLMAEQRVSTSFESLKTSFGQFMTEKSQETASYAILERIRGDLKILNRLCLPDTGLSIRSAITSWATSSNDQPVFVLLGRKGTGKSTIASTVSCELRSFNLLRSAHFLDAKSASRTTNPIRPPARSRGKSFGSLVSLSHLATRRNSNPAQERPRPGAVGSLVAEIVERIQARDTDGHVVVVDNADALIHGEGSRLIEVVQAVNSSGQKVKLLLTCATMPNWLRSADNDTEIKVSVLGVDRDSENTADIATYVSSRMCFSLSAADQQRLVDAADGTFADAVRLCDLIEDGGSPERVVDTVLYREMVAKHGDTVKVVLV